MADRAGAASKPQQATELAAVTERLASAGQELRNKIDQALDRLGTTSPPEPSPDAPSTDTAQPVGHLPSLSDTADVLQRASNQASLLLERL